MSEALKARLMAMLESEADPSRRTLMLIFIQYMDEMAQQLTVPVHEHAEDHAFVAALRLAEEKAKSGFEKVLWSWAEKAGWVAVVWVAVKFGWGG